MGARLPFSNRYVFAKVMQDNPDLCKELIERILNMRVGRIAQFQVEAEATGVIRRGVRFDVFMESDEAAFEVEMQTYEQRELPLRMRYCRSQLDRRMLGKGDDFSKLRPVYVIFICTTDPFGEGLPVYTFTSRCEENPSTPFANGAVDIVLSAASDLAQARPEVASLLRYVATDVSDDSDSLTERLSDAVREAHEDEEWVRGMDWLDWDIRDAKEAAAREGRAEGLERGLTEGRAEGRAEGRVEGEAGERDRQARLVSAMEAAGKSAEEILAALKAADRESLYASYHITDGQAA